MTRAISAICALAVCATATAAFALVAPMPSSAQPSAATGNSAYEQGSRELFELGATHVTFVDAVSGDIVGGLSGNSYRYVDPVGG